MFQLYDTHNNPLLPFAMGSRSKPQDFNRQMMKQYYNLLLLGTYRYVSCMHDNQQGKQKLEVTVNNSMRDIWNRGNNVLCYWTCSFVLSLYNGLKDVCVCFILSRSNF